MSPKLKPEMQVIRSIPTTSARSHLAVTKEGAGVNPPSLIAPPTQTTPSQKTPLALPASIEFGADVNSRFGLSLDEQRLVLVMPDIPGLSSDAVYCPYEAMGMLAEVQPLVITGAAVSVAVILDLQVLRTAEYLAQNLRSDLPLLLVSPNGLIARLVRIRVAEAFADSIEDAAEHFSAVRTVRPQAFLYLLSLHDLTRDFAELLGGVATDQDGVTSVHVRCVLEPEHLLLLNGMSLASFLALGHKAPSLAEIWNAVMSRR